MYCALFIIAGNGNYLTFEQLTGGIVHMKKYERTELIITEFDSEDVIATSGALDPGGGSESSGGSGFNLTYEEYEGGLFW